MKSIFKLTEKMKKAYKIYIYVVVWTWIVSSILIMVLDCERAVDRAIHGWSSVCMALGFLYFFVWNLLKEKDRDTTISTLTFFFITLIAAYINFFPPSRH